jgi:hypothetical protein
MSAFRELRYGCMLYMSAMLGAVVCYGLLVPAAWSGSAESHMREDASAIIVGSIAGCAAWLIFKYSYLAPHQR